MTTKRRDSTAKKAKPAQPTVTLGERWQDAEEFRWAARHWAARIGGQSPRIQIRPMTTKWASISTAGRLTLNTELLDIPKLLGEFVIVHELVHLLVPNHGKVFKSFLHAYMPDWQGREQALRQYGSRTTTAGSKPSKQVIAEQKPVGRPKKTTSPAGTVPPVLVVDDDPTIRRMLTELLTMEGYTVHQAVHGGEGLHQMLASDERLVVLLGLSMPEVNGEEVLEVVARDSRLAARHAIVVVSGSRTWATTGRVAELRGQLDIPFLAKPFNVTQLLDALEQAIRQLATRSAPKAMRRRSGRESDHE